MVVVPAHHTANMMAATFPVKAPAQSNPSPRHQAPATSAARLSLTPTDMCGFVVLCSTAGPSAVQFGDGTWTSQGNRVGGQIGSRLALDFFATLTRATIRLTRQGLAAHRLKNLKSSFPCSWNGVQETIYNSLLGDSLYMRRSRSELSAVQL